MMTNSHGETFNVGDRVHWDDTTTQHTASIRRFLPDPDGVAVLFDGPFKTVYVPIDSLYHAKDGE